MKTDQLHLPARLSAQFRGYFGTDLGVLGDRIWNDRLSATGHPCKSTLASQPAPSHCDVNHILDMILSFREERYTASGSAARTLRQAYYLLRPLLPACVRQLIHRQIFESRAKQNFPTWPLDCSVDQLFRVLMGLILEISGEEHVPFIWFWPKGHSAALMMTHDVECRVGAVHCPALMDLDDSFGIPAAFQLIPEGPYDPIKDLVKEIRLRGHEVNLHDLDHDGRLYENADRFTERAKKIRKYAETYGTRGFRSGSMHRNQDWLPQLGVEFDMSVPNVAHMEPQGGGCCTVMPYFVDNVLELPLTTVQDYGLFNILKESSIDLWKTQLETILSQNGLISFIVHPDYIVGAREQKIYAALLDYLARQRCVHSLWAARPGEINDWWRQRQHMRLVRNDSGWIVEGEGSERAHVAYATVIDEEVQYQLEPAGLKAASAGNVG